ncbi:MAG: peptidoglycan-binding protein [Candidatus Sungbacteria bacterium]|nr:peptidoglycan-binding protein [Candidatus Sungbacteria bacterium]
MPRIFLRFALAVFFVGLPLAALADASVQSFEIYPNAITSGQTISLTWKTVNSSGAKLWLPCISSVRYKDQSGVSLGCDTKLTGFGTNDGTIVTVINTTGSTLTVTPKLIPVGADGNENLAAQAQVSFTVATNSDPISDFSAASTTVVSGENVKVTWSAPDTEHLNMTLSCTDDIMPTIVGDSRPRVPCNQQPIFITDLGPTGSQTFTFNSTSLEAVLATLRLLPKTSSGAYDGTHAKSIQFSVKPAPDTRHPAINSFIIGNQTLKPGEETVISWSILRGVGANLKISCPNGVTATSSKTGASVLPCNQSIFSSILGTNDLFKITFQNPMAAPQDINVTLIPAVSATELDATVARELRIVVLGNPAGLSEAVAPPAVTPTAAASIASTSAVKTPISPVSPKLFELPVAFNAQNNADVRRMQEIMRDEGVYSGPITGNFFSLTREAVKKFQEKYGLDQVGTVGPKTRAKLNEVASGKSSSSVAPSQAPISSPATFGQIVKTLQRGNRSDEVLLLQKILASDPSIYPEGTISGFFGPATEAALKKFQAAHGLDQVGFSGPKTRAKLNEIARQKGIR